MSILNYAARGASALALLAALGAPLRAEGYKVEVLVPGSDFHGVHGLGIGPDGQILAGSVIGQTLYTVDPASGTVGIEVAAPDGMADDIAFAPDGTMAWTGFLTGDLFARKPGGEITKLASGLPGINSLAYRSDGRLYATQVFLSDALYEIDTTGQSEPRKIIEGMGGLNGFQFGPDDKIYGPLWFKGQVVKVDVDSGEIEVVADGFKVPAAVNLDSKGNIWALDTAQGQLVKIDPQSGEKETVAQLSTSLDNLAINDRDEIFVSNMADNGIQQVNPDTGEIRQIVKGQLSMPGGLDLAADEQGETLYLADLFAYRTINAATGEVTDVARMHSDHLEYPINARVKGDHVVLSSWFTGTVQVFDRKTGESLKLLHGFAAPEDAIELEDGSLLVLEIATGKLLRVSGEEGETRDVVAEGLVVPVGMVPDGPSGVFVTEAGAGSVSRIDLATGEKLTLASGLAMPEGLDTGPDGLLYVAEVGKKQVISISPENGAVSVLATDLPIGAPAPAGMPPTSMTTGIAVGGDGTVYVTSDIENAVYKLSPM